MKNEKISYLTKQDLFGKKNRIIQVKSFSYSDRVYEIDPKARTCTCREFLRSKNKLLCKHLILALNIKNKDGFPVSLLKSSVQKGVRRGDVKRALSPAKSWLRKNPSDFFRRLAIVIVEDAILHPDYARVVELAGISARKSFVLTKEIEIFALAIVEQLAKIDIRDCEFFGYSNNFKSINIVPFVPFEELGKQEREIVRALFRRSRSGGMPGDIKMLSLLTRIWAYRFKTKIITLRKLKSIYNDIPTRKNYNDIPLKLTVNDILLEGADFHCMPMLPILLRKPFVAELIKKHYPDDVITVEERLRSILWKMRSGVCGKKDYSTGEPIDWFEKPFNTTPDADKERYTAIYEILKVEIDKLSAWFINKNK